MKSIIPYPCVKFGKEEHLKSLAKGEVFFSPLEVFINDGTDYRGDPNEGATFIDPSTFDISVDGKNLFRDMGIPRPISIKQTIQGYEDVHIFCCCVLREDVWDGDRKLYIKDSVKQEMKKFGPFGLVFDINELLRNISLVSEQNNVGYIADYVVYKNIYSDFAPVKFDTESVYNRFFIKDVSYKHQHEYRIVIDGRDALLKNNCENGYSLRTTPLSSAILFDTDTLLNTATIILDE